MLFDSPWYLTPASQLLKFVLKSPQGTYDTPVSQSHHNMVSQSPWGTGIILH